MIDMYDRGAAKFKWWPDWRGECVAIVGGGPSASKVGVEKLRDRIHVVVINESYRLCPWADILYSCDAEWWKLRSKEVKKFAGLKLAFGNHASVAKMGLSEIQIKSDRKMYQQDYANEFLFDEPGVIGSGGNSGFQTINLVSQFGATGILLVAFDMNLSAGLHWHGVHPSPLRNPDETRFKEWPVTIDRCAPKLAQHDIEVVNASPHSSLRAFKKFTIEQALERWSL